MKYLEDITEPFLASFTLNKIKADVTLELIDKPLLIKIPVLKEVYQVVKNKINDYQDDIVIFDRSKKTDTDLRYLVESVILPQNFKFNSRGENSFIHSYEFMFRAPLEYMSDKLKFNLEYELEFGRTGNDYQNAATNQTSFVAWNSTNQLVFITKETDYSSDFFEIQYELRNKLASTQGCF